MRLGVKKTTAIETTEYTDHTEKAPIKVGVE